MDPLGIVSVAIEALNLLGVTTRNASLAPALVDGAIRYLDQALEFYPVYGHAGFVFPAFGNYPLWALVRDLLRAGGDAELLEFRRAQIDQANMIAITVGCWASLRTL